MGGVDPSSDFGCPSPPPPPCCPEVPLECPPLFLPSFSLNSPGSTDMLTSSSRHMFTLQVLLGYVYRSSCTHQYRTAGTLTYSTWCFDYNFADYFQHQIRSTSLWSSHKPVSLGTRLCSTSQCKQVVDKPFFPPWHLAPFLHLKFCKVIKNQEDIMLELAPFSPPHTHTHLPLPSPPSPPLHTHLPLPSLKST